jgi:tetratricopeptide (TPR) repeat protein
MSTAMALQSFKALWSTLSNEDMSFGDKMISLMMTLGMLIPSVTAALNAENLAKMVGLKLTKDANGKLIVENGLKTTNVVITWLQKIAQDALNGSLLATVGLFALIAVAVIAVVGIFMLLTKKRESDAEKARKAHAEELKQLEALTEAYNELKNTVDEVKEAISDYTTALDALKELEKGTDEYEKALEDVNKQAEELIKNHNLIRNIDWHYGSYGEIIINDDVLKDIEKKNEALLSNAQISVLR